MQHYFILSVVLVIKRKEDKQLITKAIEIENFLRVDETKLN